MKKRLEQNLIAAVRSYWLWLGDEGAAASQMRHTCQGAMVACGHILGWTESIALLEASGLCVPVEFTCESVGHWLKPETVNA